MAVDITTLTKRQRNIYYRRIVIACCYGDLSYRYIQEREAGDPCADTTLLEMQYIFQVLEALFEDCDTFANEEYLCLLVERASAICPTCDACEKGLHIDVNNPTFPPDPDPICDEDRDHDCNDHDLNDHG